MLAQHETMPWLSRGALAEGLLVICVVIKLLSILIQNEQLEQVDTFPYLGCLITEDGECMMEFRTRLNRGQAIGPSLQKIWKHTDFNEDRLMKALVWPVAMYSCESWTFRKNED